MTRHQASYQATAEPDPGMLIRILNLFALRDHVPSRVRSRVLAGQLQVDVDVAGLADLEAEQIAQRMRSLVGVRGVRLEQMRWREAA
ncbi:hypothetical protein L6Q21_02510 [Sandaracinobacter sp. RS1-74]|uniref:hypothetical protein n=1 Tax=Sandaracinobacteroides sayramensis TaxID=2913411 RepID=UPI001EDBEEB9|nr:hypothetical protein [Sandaracinobacteroides sayramensis]MCG2839854.1 hypothetical protein [Sandaracinobacteroides sayramensis]